jgi:hypothetical protein
VLFICCSCRIEMVIRIAKNLLIDLLVMVDI